MHARSQELVWKELNYGLMNEREKQPARPAPTPDLGLAPLTPLARARAADVARVVERCLYHSFLYAYLYRDSQTYGGARDRGRFLSRAPHRA